MMQPLLSWLLKRPATPSSWPNSQKPCNASVILLQLMHHQTSLKYSTTLMATNTCPSAQPVKRRKMLQSPWKAMVLEFRSEQLSRVRENHCMTLQCVLPPHTQQPPGATLPATMNQPQSAPPVPAPLITITVQRMYSLYPPQLSMSLSSPQCMLMCPTLEGLEGTMLWELSAAAPPALEVPLTSVAAAKTTKKLTFPKGRRNHWSGWRLLMEEEMHNHKTLSDEIAELAAGKTLSMCKCAVLHVPYLQYQRGSS